ncbi:DNA polymerase [Aphelenchoides besseyi]|nr:DNA polymerase [Aphelenchoides besseyi]
MTLNLTGSMVKSAVEMPGNVDWRKYERVSLPHSDTNVQLALQFLDVDYVTVSDGVRFRIFGTTMNGNSVCCSIHDYIPYFYVQTPESYLAENLSTYIKEINAEVKRKSLFYRYGDVGIVRQIEEVHGANIMGYNEKMDDRFLKIYIRFPSLMILCQQAIGTVFCNGDLQFYETNVDVELRFMIDNRMVGCGWIECKANSYTLNTKEPETTCQLEISTTMDGIVVHSPENDAWSLVAPLRILSFDIECSGRPNQFPEPRIDPIIQIACSCQTLGDDKSFARVCFVLNGCLPIDNVQIVDCADEDQMLSEWARFIRAVDPDIITGYNIHAFDFVYITERLKCLRNESIRNYVLRIISRTSNSPCVVRDVQKTSKEKGSRTYKQVRINGRVVLDTYWAIRREHTLRSYTLNNVSYHFLGERKEDVEYKNITNMHQGTANDRRRLASYCLKDAELPLKLLNHLMVIINNVEMARVTGVPLNLLITQGQQVRIVFQLLRKAKSLNYLFPSIKRSGEEDVPCEGGLVFEPRRGYYPRPIVTLDFASLYPTIMIAYNLCYTTLIQNLPDDYVQDVDYIRAPSGDFFATPKRKHGLKMVLNGRQLALKISANSIYGFTGATSGKLYNRELCQAITSFGRWILERTKELIETNSETESYSRRNFCVLYGDTDSVMVDFDVTDVGTAIEVGKEIAQFISSNCKRPIELKFEKVYDPYLLIQKKRYAGVCYTSSSDVPDKIETKGLETIRRDNCPLIGNVMSQCMDLMLLKRDPEGAVSYAKKIIADLNQSKIDISQLIISKELRKTNSQYRNDQPHASVAQLLQKRDPATAPQLGDRVPFVFVKRADKTLAADKAEDPSYVIANKIPIDYDYYFRHQLLNPLVRLLNPVTNEKAEEILTTGKHARKHLTPISKTVGIGSYMKDVHTCFNCKRKRPPLCKKCTSEFGQVYTKKMFDLRDTQQRFARLWSECQNCVKNFTNEVQCTAKDCQIFYAREKVRYDLEEVTEVIRRFDLYEKEEPNIDVIMIDDD